MLTKIAKDFIWEMSHRLTFHNGPCKNIHGHSYKLRVEIEGDLDGNSMLLDYYDLEQIVRPLINQLDHAFLCDKNDDIMLPFLKQHGFKHFTIDAYTTAENMVTFFIDEFTPKFKQYDNINSLMVQVYETFDVYAERKVSLK